MRRLMALLKGLAKSPTRGLSVRQKPMVGSWDSSDPVCLAIAELSRHGMAKRGGASHPVSAPHALALNILRRTRASKGSQNAIFVAVVGTRETKSNRLCLLAFHLFFNGRTFRILQIIYHIGTLSAIEVSATEAGERPLTDIQRPFVAAEWAGRFCPIGVITKCPAGAHRAIRSSARCSSFDNAESRLTTYERHVVGHYGLDKALEGECANLFGCDASL
jgi:hypothetical protein